MLWLSAAIVDAANRGRPEHQRRQGRRSPVVVGVDGRHHGGAVVPRADQRGPGLGQAARLAGAARDQLPARRPRRDVPADAARQGRPAVLPLAPQGPRHRRLLHRLGRHRRHRRAVGRDLAPLRALAVRRRAAGRPVHQPARRRRARRGRHLGGRRRPAGRPPRRAALGRRPQPAVAGPGRPRHPDRPAAGHVRGRRLAGRHAEVGPPDLRAVRPAGRRRAAPPARGDAQRGVPADAPRRLRPRWRRGSWGRAARRSCGRCSTRCLRRQLAAAVRDLGGHDLGLLVDTFRAVDTDAPDGRLRLHRQGPRPADRGPPQQPLRAADRGPDAGAGRRAPAPRCEDPWATVRAGHAPQHDLCRARGAALRRTPVTAPAAVERPHRARATRTASPPRPRPRSAACSPTSSTTPPRPPRGW